MKHNKTNNNLSELHAQLSFHVWEAKAFWKSCSLLGQQWIFDSIRFDSIRCDRYTPWDRPWVARGTNRFFGLLPMPPLRRRHSKEGGNNETMDDRMREDEIWRCYRFEGDGIDTYDAIDNDFFDPLFSKRLLMFEIVRDLLCGSIWFRFVSFRLFIRKSAEQPSGQASKWINEFMNEWAFSSRIIIQQNKTNPSHNFPKN